jgi:pimeloyl-ACP methyl ester carboxylesterase
VLGLPVMQELRRSIVNCSDPFLLEDGGHFLQEWGDEVAAAALRHWN